MNDWSGAAVIIVIAICITAYNCWDTYLKRKYPRPEDDDET